MTQNELGNLVVPTTGLEGVIAAQSGICFIDGEQAKLGYRGYDVVDLAEHSSFEEVVYLLWQGRLPNRDELEGISARLARERNIPGALLETMQTIFATLGSEVSTMDTLRSMISFLSFYDPDLSDKSQQANIRRAIELVAKTATIVAAADRIYKGLDVILPDRDLSHAANFLYMLKGKAPDENAARIFDACLVLHADHEFNASTFAARVTAATLADMYAAITSAIGALKGPLHGGANVDVKRMLLELGEVDHVEPYIKKKLEAKERIPGFGHRVYKKAIDPRAVALKDMARRLIQASEERRLFDISCKIEEVMWREKQLYPNVDFYSATVYHILKIPNNVLIPIFAASRMAGWTAHVLEQYENNRLIRPRAEYIGPHNQTYAPLGSR
jgi:citrate synthase